MTHNKNVEQMILKIFQIDCIWTLGYLNDILNKTEVTKYDCLWYEVTVIALFVVCSIM